MKLLVKNRKPTPVYEEIPDSFSTTVKVDISGFVRTGDVVTCREGCFRKWVNLKDNTDFVYTRIVSSFDGYARSL